jgi:hypothetical protein
MPVRVVVTSVGPDGVLRVERDGPAAATLSLASLEGVELSYPLQVGVPPEDVNAGGDPAGGVGPMVPPPGLLNFFQLRLRPGYPAPRGTAELAVIVDEMREKLPGMLAVMDSGKGAQRDVFEPGHPHERPPGRRS